MASGGIHERVRHAAAQRVLYLPHAVHQMARPERMITPTEVRMVVERGELIEDYPEDKYSPSCLIYGKTEAVRDLHVQVSFPPRVVVITLYEPDPEEWIDYRVRR